MNPRLLALIFLGTPMLIQFSFGQVSVGVDTRTGQPATYINPMGPFGGSDVRQDRLMQVMQGLELSDRLDRSEQQRQQQSIDNQFRAREQQLKSQQLELENQRNNVDIALARRIAETEKINQESNQRLKYAASAAAQFVSNINPSDPNAEKEIYKAMATSFENHLDTATINTIFSPILMQINKIKMNEISPKESYLNKELVGDLIFLLQGEPKLLYESLLARDVNPTLAIHLTKKSMAAKTTYEWYVKYRAENQMPITTDSHDMSMMCKGAPAYWDMDEVMRWAYTKVLTKEFIDKVKQEHGDIQKPPNF